MSRFSTTRWSVVVAAQGDGDAARSSLESLCRTYRPAVLTYVASRGFARDRAEDLTQSFFARFLERKHHLGLDPSRGRFRNYLLTAIQHFLISAEAGENAVKRGRHVQFERIDEASTDPDGATGIAELPTAAHSPEQAFDEAWALAVLDAAMLRLRQEAHAAGKGRLFEGVEPYLAETPDPRDYERIAGELNLRRNTVAVSVHRLRQRLRELVREEVAETAADGEALDAEMQALRDALGGGGA